MSLGVGVLLMCLYILSSTVEISAVEQHLYNAQ